MKSFCDRFSPSCIARAEEHIVRLLKESRSRYEDYSFPIAEDPDYAQAYGIYQGLAFSKGMKSQGDVSDANSPIFWFESLKRKVYNAAAIASHAS